MSPIVEQPQLEPGRVSPNLMVELPWETLRQAGIRRGDLLRIEADGHGRLALTKVEDALEPFIGSMPGIDKAVGLIPPGVAATANIQSGDTLATRADGERRLVVERMGPWVEFIGSMPGLENDVNIAGLRAEWDR
jgi:bifunctional DNA-binding transcriptional regulator/antitoxin component of YhaV-PrlF toxin-antitoxin module